MTDATESLPPTNNNHRKHLLIGLAAIFIFIGLTWIIYWYGWGQFKEYTDDAYVGGNIVQLTSQVPGTVTAIYGDDTALVNAGTNVISLDDSNYHLNFEQAKAELAKTVRQVKQLFRNDAEYQATITIKTAELNKANSDLARRKQLVKSGAISKEELQRAQTIATTAEAALEEAKQRYLANYALIANTTLASNPLVLAAAAKFRQAYVNLSRTNLLAPVTGYLAKRSVQLGQQIAPGVPLLAIVPLNQLWVEANFKESQLENIRLGQPVTITADQYGNNTKFHGKVVGLSAGTGSAFSLLPAQNATGNWIKIVQRIPVRISLEPSELIQHPLRIGLSTRVTISTQNRNGSTLANTTVTKPTYTSMIYANQFSNTNKIATAEIENIIKANESAPMINTEKLDL